MIILKLCEGVRVAGVDTCVATQKDLKDPLYAVLMVRVQMKIEENGEMNSLEVNGYP
jgi:hypothetical protein